MKARHGERGLQCRPEAGIDRPICCRCGVWPPDWIRVDNAFDLFQKERGGWAHTTRPVSESSDRRCHQAGRATTLSFLHLLREVAVESHLLDRPQLRLKPVDMFVRVDQHMLQEMTGGEIARSGAVRHTLL